MKYPLTPLCGVNMISLFYYLIAGVVAYKASILFEQLDLQNASLFFFLAIYGLIKANALEQKGK